MTGIPDSAPGLPRASRGRRAYAALPVLVCLALAASACLDAGRPGYLRRLHPCVHDEGPSGAYCGTLAVFEDRMAAASRRIDLAVVVLPALSDEQRPDPLLFLAGGPGQGAARMAAPVGAAFARVRRHRDIVLVDQRGTGRSHPLECPSAIETLEALFTADEDPSARVRACLEHLDADVRHYTTVPAMDDLDAVRAWLGYERVNLYGGSYGTRAALVYLRRHERHVRSVVLDGAAPTAMRLPLFAARDADRALARLLGDCDADAACAAAYPGMTHRIRALLARLERRPPEVRLAHPRTGAVETVRVTARAVAGVIFGALYSPATASVLPLLIDAAERGDFQGLTALAVAADTSENMSVGMQLSVLCSEDAPRISLEDVARETTGRTFGTWLVADQLNACDAWPRAVVDPSYYDPVTSGVPTLILSGDVDPVTPPSWGEEVARHLPRSRHLVAPATGHGVAATGCGARLIADFLEAGIADGLDAGCLSMLRRPPFFLTPSGPEQVLTPLGGSGGHTAARDPLPPRRSARRASGPWTETADVTGGRIRR
jgi:pimeloyl-ACP methyl ester carboxylesterase